LCFCVGPFTETDISPLSPPPTILAGAKIDASGKPQRSRDVLTAAMTRLGFELIHSEDVPFLIREHARKFQWGCSDGTVWKLAA
jgi:hypothetical protein